MASECNSTAAAAAAASPSSPERRENETKSDRKKDVLLGSLMVAASLIAASTYQAAVSPPARLVENPKNHIKLFFFRLFNFFSFANAIDIIMLLTQEAVIHGSSSVEGIMKVVLGISLLSFSAAFALTFSPTWMTFFFAMMSPIYYYFLSLAIEWSYKRKQGKRQGGLEAADTPPATA